MIHKINTTYCWNPKQITIKMLYNLLHQNLELHLYTRHVLFFPLHVFPILTSCNKVYVYVCRCVHMRTDLFVSEFNLVLEIKILSIRVQVLLPDMADYGNTLIVK